MDPALYDEELGKQQDIVWDTYGLTLRSFLTNLILYYNSRIDGIYIRLGQVSHEEEGINWLNILLSGFKFGFSALVLDEIDFGSLMGIAKELFKGLFSNVKFSSRREVDEEGNPIEITEYSFSFLSKSDAADTYLTKTNAADTYLTKTDATDTYLTKTDSFNFLTKSDAAHTYLTKTNAADTYLTKTDAADTYLTKTNATDIYLTKSSATVIYLTKNNATNTYLTKTDASDNYINKTTFVEFKNNIEDKFDSKADITYVDNNLILKANITDVDSSLSSKANTTYVNNTFCTKTTAANMDERITSLEAATSGILTIKAIMDITYPIGSLFFYKDCIELTDGKPGYTTNTPLDYGKWENVGNRMYTLYGNLGILNGAYTDKPSSEITGNSLINLEHLPNHAHNGVYLGNDMWRTCGDGGKRVMSDEFKPLNSSYISYKNSSYGPWTGDEIGSITSTGWFNRRGSQSQFHQYGYYNYCYKKTSLN